MDRELIERVARRLTQELGMDPEMQVPATPLKMWELRTNLAEAALEASDHAQLVEGNYILDSRNILG